ncbi:hypothetical protein ABE82_26030 (plasmid) [Paenibacillus peoriae]|uniref:ThiF family adenylyltransferase n=1 Tax=Paenibacillus peoriae TaxID=59893 RepID=UPI00071FAA53|nr:ThiF family adenylyltransferase [Paenibacillus peoriae]ALS09880.1 hypothetical protein ABE82_26030 [Paenibacillus peoriae]
MHNLLDYHNRNGYLPKYKKMHFNMVLIGAGGTGGLLVQRLAKMMFAFENVGTSLILADPDLVELKNLLRQPFISKDVGHHKAEVLARRYGSTYGVKIGYYTASYIENTNQLRDLFSNIDYTVTSGTVIQNVLIGAVDNDFSRGVMNQFFNEEENLVYIDAGIEGVWLPDEEKDISVWTEEELEMSRESGYSGQVVVGLKKNNKVILEPVNGVYPLDVHDAIPPWHNCSLDPYQPQRMIANEFAAMHIAIILNGLFQNFSLDVHYINYNGRTGVSRPILI